MTDFMNFSMDNLSNNTNFNFLKNLISHNEDDNTVAYDFLNTDNCDSPYQNATFSCSYYDETEFCNSFSKDKRFSIMSLNVQSLPAKFADLKDFLNFLHSNSCSPDIICLQEIWKIPSSNFFSFDGYQPLLLNAVLFWPVLK